VKSALTVNEILQRKSEFLDAIDLYRNTCVALITQYQNGTLASEWCADEHGEHCLFRDLRTGQAVEAPLDPLWPPGLDPYFFGQFVQTTDSLHALAGIIRDAFHDSASTTVGLYRYGGLK
jgi:hypothetical protein